MIISQFTSFLEQAFKNKRRVLAVGKPGVGKTFTVKEACRRLDMDYLSISCPTIDPTYTRGYPYRNNGTAGHALFGTMALAMNATKPTVLHFDDLGMASESVLKSVIEFIQFGMIDRQKLPDHVVIHASTNDVMHGAGVYGMIEPLKSRWHAIVEVETHVDDVITYGMVNGWPDDMLAFLRNSPDAVNDWKPSKSMHIDGACPRGWDYAAQWISDGIDDQEVLAGCVGKGQATAYLAYREMIKDLPDINSVLMNPETADVPENPSARYLVTMALASRMSNENFGSVVTYLDRLDTTMFVAAAIKDATRAETEKKKQDKLPKGYRHIHLSKDYAKFVSSARGKEIMNVF